MGTNRRNPWNKPRNPLGRIRHTARSLVDRPLVTNRVSGFSPGQVSMKALGLPGRGRRSNKAQPAVGQAGKRCGRRVRKRHRGGAFQLGSETLSCFAALS
jgi:hypothetical protein